MKNITQAYINAIHRYHDKIACIGHPCRDDTSMYLDVKTLAQVLNQYSIPIELNCANLAKNKTNLEKLNQLLPLIEAGIYVNSDMHTLHDFSHRQAGFNYLQER